MNNKRFMFPVLLLILLCTSVVAWAQEGESAPVQAPSLMHFFLTPKYITMLILGLTAFILLKTRWMKPPLKVLLLVLAVFFFGIAGNFSVPFLAGYAMHPSPLCATTKAILYGFAKPMIVVAGIITLLTLLGPKLFCGWVCPVGGLQELLSMLARKLKLRLWRAPFRLTQSVRVIIFLLFLFLSGTAVVYILVEGEKVAFPIYDWFNAFHGFEFEKAPALLDIIIRYGALVVTIVLGLFIYRPYCHFVCPVGLLTHLLEPIALFRIRRKAGACDDCGACVPCTPCQSVPEVIKGAVMRPDCFGCGECLSSCRKDAFELGIGNEAKK